jgi:tRNA(Met) C34 N-acetyltransferase TmcA
MTTTRDEEAVRRYHYLLRTADPDQLERAHAEAFDQLTASQRRLVLERLADELPPAERMRLSEDPQVLARAATRAELRRPGTLERVLGGQRGAILTGVLGGVALAVAGAVAVDALFDVPQGSGPSVFDGFDFW